MTNFIFETGKEKNEVSLFNDLEGNSLDVKDICFSLPPQAEKNWGRSSSHDAGSVCVYLNNPKTNKDYVGIVQVRNMDNKWKIDKCVVQIFDDGNYEKTVEDWRKDDKSFKKYHYMSGCQPLNVCVSGVMGFTVLPPKEGNDGEEK
ncbi:hypothetical protein HOM13_03720 [Candidatus Woesearchaeota archaeon]|jgi:hypothetical protein|nr:hypothetical protein [Candidatus Woesearchaeota archaeon]MBT5215817.1 hypothetical protein [Candidatus Woesearchaeota archaeon]MBT6402276.1 hypothetical protein [Candidatus Woesearchaeota archaeon]